MSAHTVYCSCLTELQLSSSQALHISKPTSTLKVSFETVHAQNIHSLTSSLLGTPVHLHVYAVSQVATVQCGKSSRLPQTSVGFHIIRTSLGKHAISLTVA